VRLGRATAEFRYVYFWHRMNRKGQACAVLARGAMNSCLVLFEDGFRAITSRNAIRKAPGKTPEQTPERGDDPA
jgi:hypothetical protein